MCGQQAYLTEAIILIHMIQVEQLKLTGMCYFIRKFNLDDMLIERSDSMPTLDFEKNEDFSLR